MSAATRTRSHHGVVEGVVDDLDDVLDHLDCAPARPAEGSTMSKWKLLSQERMPDEGSSQQSMSCL